MWINCSFGRWHVTGLQRVWLWYVLHCLFASILRPFENSSSRDTVALKERVVKQIYALQKTPNNILRSMPNVRIHILVFAPAMHFLTPLLNIFDVLGMSLDIWCIAREWWPSKLQHEIEPSSEAGSIQYMVDELGDGPIQYMVDHLLGGGSIFPTGIIYLCE